MKPAITREEIMQALARGYSGTRNLEKEIDIDLIVAMADEMTRLIREEFGEDAVVEKM